MLVLAGMPCDRWGSARGTLTSVRRVGLTGQCKRGAYRMTLPRLDGAQCCLGDCQGGGRQVSWEIECDEGDDRGCWSSSLWDQIVSPQES